MIEEQLIQYGVLGIWTASLLLDRWRNQIKLNKVIENNTIALTKNYEVLKQYGQYGKTRK